MRVLSFIAACVFFTGCNCGGRVEQVDVSVDVAPRTLDFGLQAPGGVARQQLTLTAHGAAVKLDRILVREDVRGSFSVGIAPITLSPEQPVSVEVLYAPRTEGADSAMVVVTFLDAFDELLVPLVGRSQVAALMDAGSVDAGMDGGMPDAGAPDAGEFDAGEPDAGAPDAGAFDDGGFDAGPPPDYGPPLCPVATTTQAVSTTVTALPNLTWVGSGYVIAADERSGTIMEITLQRTNARGVRVAGPIAFTPSDGFHSIWPSVSFSGVQYGVTWLDDRTPVRRAYFARADSNLQPVPGSERPLSSASVSANSARVAWNAALGEWGLAWAESGGELHFERLSPGGVSLGHVVLGAGFLSDNGNPFIATPTGWALVATGTPPRVFELGAGAPVITTLPGLGRRASIAFGAGQLAVTYDTNGRVQFLRVQGSVVVANSLIGLGTVGAYPPSIPSVGFNGQDFIAVWSETYAGSPSPLKFARISPSATTSNIAGSVLTTKSNAGFNSLAMGSCGFGLIYGVFATTPDTLEVYP